MNHLGFTREEKEVIDMKKDKKEWNRWTRDRERRRVRKLEREVRDIAAGARRGKILSQVENDTGSWQLLLALGRSDGYSEAHVNFRPKRCQNLQLRF